MPITAPLKQTGELLVFINDIFQLAISFSFMK